jgi:drug/metabolite transporter (DMT)-like permease
MLPVVLALLSSASWGVFDFLGGVLSRRFRALSVALTAQGFGLVAASILAATAGKTFAGVGIALGALAGLCGAVSVAAFYRAMSTGLMSAASPLLACGSVVAFAIAIGAGERPPLLAVVGCMLALAGAVLTSVVEHGQGGGRRDGLFYALVAALAFGISLFLLGRASVDTGAFPAVAAQRASSFMLLMIIAATMGQRLRPEPRLLPLAATVGLGTTAAFLLFSLATTRGLISVVAMLSSLYPVITVLLAHLLLGERLRGSQLVGVSAALLGVALVAASR